jgi:hypothetical protein
MEEEIGSVGILQLGVQQLPSPNAARPSQSAMGALQTSLVTAALRSGSSASGDSKTDGEEQASVTSKRDKWPEMDELSSLMDTLKLRADVAVETAKTTFQQACSSLEATFSSVDEALSQHEASPYTKDEDVIKLYLRLRKGYEKEIPTQPADRKSAQKDIRLLMALRRADALKTLESAVEFLNEELGLKGEAAITVPEGSRGTGMRILRFKLRSSGCSF